MLKPVVNTMNRKEQLRLNYSCQFPGETFYQRPFVLYRLKDKDINLFILPDMFHNSLLCHQVLFIQHNIGKRKKVIRPLKRKAV